MSRNHKIRLLRITQWVLQHWLLLFLVFFGVFNLLPFLAPVLAKLGFDSLANIIYILYAPLCHQMAQRSFFLFGDQITYMPQQFPLDLTASTAQNMIMLKQFTGDENIGWKVAWSDRMVYMYGATWLFAAVYTLISRRYRVKRLSIAVFTIFLLPILLDGITHMLSDFNGGLFEGIRYTNQWLVNLTSNVFPEWFYVGDAFGSFNSWMRLISGIGFGAAVIGLTFPMVGTEMQHNSDVLMAKLQHISGTT